MKSIIVFALATVALAKNVPTYGAPATPRYPSVAPAYWYNYAVNDDYGKINLAKSENRDGYATSGQYTVALPDGRVQTVTYSVNGDSGYVADVKYSGQARYDEYKPAAVQGFDSNAEEPIRDEDELDVRNASEGHNSGPAPGSGSTLDITGIPGSGFTPDITGIPGSGFTPDITAIPGFAELALEIPGGPAALQQVLNDPQVLDFITKHPGIIKKFAELAAAITGEPAALQKILNDPQVLDALDFITKNPDIVKKFVSEEKLQALLALAKPPPPGAKQGVFGPDIFEGEVFEVQGFDQDGTGVDNDEGSDYGDFEGK